MRLRMPEQAEEEEQAEEITEMRKTQNKIYILRRI